MVEDGAGAGEGKVAFFCAWREWDRMGCCFFVAFLYVLCIILGGAGDKRIGVFVFGVR